MAPKTRKGVTCTVGATRDGVTELLATGVMVYVTGETEIVPGTELAVGRKVLADHRTEWQAVGAGQGMVAVRVRPYGPDGKDVAALQALLAKLARAGVPDPGFGDPAAFLGRLFDKRLQTGTGAPLNLTHELVTLLEAKDLRFPMDSWQHDVGPAVSEMEEKLTALGVAAPLPRERIEAVFEQHAADDEWEARRHFCAAIAGEANTALEQAGQGARWFELGALPWEDDEPFWLLVTPAQREGLVREKIFKPAK